MEENLHLLRALVAEAVKTCADPELLDLVWRLLTEG